ncbi:threonine-phosphate decarboxylase CobD [Tianweitania sediminis]|uniref:threonine-phosphate decarboxylase n=1 Tax=Tianweitania sediminis TaxID=1502156 RepID=A0A8J7R1H1_9HYPH|nr:threonine-phosphate decarboxylase CobD [Tianweitania sediminis]MBP0441008.1 threonine-phosphate decarboxylase [Tianweitania sediminis]
MRNPVEVPAVPDHGGSLAGAEQRFPQAPKPWVDLSTGINPHAYPFSPLPATAFSRLPEPEDTARLAALAARAYGVSEPACIACGPGTQILLPLVMRLLQPGRAAVLSPTYAEHARAAALVGHTVGEVGAFEALYDADLAVVVNPNNPDGRVIAREQLLHLARHLSAKGGLLVADEAFMEVGPQEHSVAGDAGREGLVVLRSFGKFYGLAGIRLGFVLADQTRAAWLNAQLGPWAVAGPTVQIASEALADQVWANDMRRRLIKETARLDGLLSRHGLVIAGGTSLFRFVRSLHASALFQHLGAQGILVRPFRFDPYVLRVGLPADDTALSRLEGALMAFDAGAA